MKSAIEASSVIIKRGNEEPPGAVAGGTFGTSAGPQGKAVHPAAFLYKEISLTKLLICLYNTWFLLIIYKVVFFIQAAPCGAPGTVPTP